MPVFTSRIETVFKRWIEKELLYCHKEFIETILNTEDRATNFDHIYKTIDSEGSIQYFIDFMEFKLTFKFYKKYRHIDRDNETRFDVILELKDSTKYLHINRIEILKKKYREVSRDGDGKQIIKNYIKKTFINDIQVELYNWIHQYLYTSFDVCKHCVVAYIRLNNEDSQCCSDCFPYIQQIGENCCICLEDEPGVWVQLNPCDHKIHKICYEKTKDNKCPLCRTEIKDFHLI